MAAEAFCEIVFEKATDTVCCGYNEKFFIKGGFIMTCLTAVFVYVVVIYNVFIG